MRESQKYDTILLRKAKSYQLFLNFFNQLHVRWLDSDLNKRFFRHIHQWTHFRRQQKSPGGSMSQEVVLPNTSYKPITNTAWVRARFCKLQKGLQVIKKSALDSKSQVIKFTSCFLVVGGSHRVFRLLPPLKLVAKIQLKYC